MRVLSNKEVERLWKRYLVWSNEPNTEIVNLTLTFDRDSRLHLRQEENGFVRAGHKFFIKLARTRKVHIFGWMAMESCSISSRSKELIGEHIHSLVCMKANRPIPLLTQEELGPLWKYSVKEQICIQAWDKNPKLLQYNYGEFPDHFHTVIPSNPYHPRSGACRRRRCELCNAFPKPEEILL